MSGSDLDLRLAVTQNGKMHIIGSDAEPFFDQHLREVTPALCGAPTNGSMAFHTGRFFDAVERDEVCTTCIARSPWHLDHDPEDVNP